MAGNDDRSPSRGLTRRFFLGASGAGLASLALPRGAWADGEGSTFDVTGLQPSEWITVQRPDDMVNLQVGLYNLVRAAGGTRLVRATHQIPGKVISLRPAFLVIKLPPQHLLEQAWEEEPPEFIYRPAGTNLSDNSRIVLFVPDEVQELPLDANGNSLTVAGLLRAIRDYPMNVSINAPPRPGVEDLPGGGTVSGLPGDPRPPAALETSIELPWRLVLSPNQFGRWSNADAPVRSTRGRVELWHTRLGTFDADGRFDDRKSPLRTARAIWNRDGEFPLPDPVLGDPDDPNAQGAWPLSRINRDQIVGATCGNTGTPIELDRLMLSSLGGWLDSHLQTPDAPLAGWVHRATMGRDHYVEVVERAHCYPYGHRLVTVKITERRLDQHRGGFADLHQRHILVAIDRTRRYDDPEHRNRMPVQAVTFLTGSEAIDNHSEGAPFVPLRFGAPLELPLELIDRDGNRVTIQAPIVVVPDGLNPRPSIAALDTLLHDAGELYDLRNQRLWLAPSTPSAELPSGRIRPGRAGDTTFEVSRLKLGGAELTYNVQPPGEAWFQPVVAAVEMAVPALRQLAGAEATRLFEYAADYVDHGFNEGNPRENLLKLVNGAAAAIPVNFTAQSDQVGGFATPNLAIQGLSRLAGPVTDLGSTVDFDPLQLLAGSAKLFGQIDLVQLIGLKDGLPDFKKLAPKFITDAMDELDRYRHLGEDLIDKIDQVQTTLAKGVEQAQQLDVPDVGQAIQDWIDAQTTRLLAIVDGLVAVLAVLERVPAAVNGSDPGLEDDLRDTTNAFRNELGNLARELVTNKYLPYVYPLVPGFDLQIREIAGVLTRVQDLTADVRAAVTAFLKGVALAKSQQLTLDWRPPIKSFEVFRVDEDADHNPIGGLVLAATIRGKPQGNTDRGVDLLLALEKFKLAIGPDYDDPWVSLHFDKFQFRAQSGKKPEIDVVFAKDKLHFGGELSFIQTIKDALPMAGFSDPPDVEITPTGLTASFTQSLPSIAVGMFSLANLAISAALEVPFVGGAMTFRFAFASREHPFTVSVAMLGGTGFFALETTADKITSIEAQVEFGASIGIDLGVASGLVQIMAGIYFSKRDDDGVRLRGFLRIRGEVDVLGLISASIELRMELEYHEGKVIGRAVLEIEVSIGFFSQSVHLECERKFAGSNDDPTFEELMPRHSGAWESYCAAFALESTPSN